MSAPMHVYLNESIQYRNDLPYGRQPEKYLFQSQYVF